MRLLFLSVCWLISLNAAFAQSSSNKGSTQSAGEIQDTSIVSLCSNASGHQGFMVKNGKGQAEFQTVDQFVKSKATAQSRNSPSRTVGVNASTSSNPTPTKIRETVVADRMAGKDSSTGQRTNKLPPVLMQGPPQH